MLLSAPLFALYSSVYLQFEQVTAENLYRWKLNILDNQPPVVEISVTSHWLSLHLGQVNLRLLSAIAYSYTLILAHSSSERHIHRPSSPPISGSQARSG